MNKERFENKENYSAGKSKLIEAAQSVFVLGGTILAAEGFINNGYTDIVAGLIIVVVSAIAPLGNKSGK